MRSRAASCAPTRRSTSPCRCSGRWRATRRSSTRCRGTTSRGRTSATSTPSGAARGARARHRRRQRALRLRGGGRGGRPHRRRRAASPRRAARRGAARAAPPPRIGCVGVGRHGAHRQPLPSDGREQPAGVATRAAAERRARRARHTAAAARRRPKQRRRPAAARRPRPRRRRALPPHRAAAAPPLPLRAPPLGVPAGRFAPYNAQATVHSYRALWALLLPMSVPGRVSDIWRGYAAQRLLWDVGLHLAFAPPRVTQRRNAHNLAADVQAEAALYLETESLLRFLHGWRCSAHCRRPLHPPPPPAAACPRLPFCMLELWGALYEHGFVKLADVRLLRLWVGELLGAGYVFPPYLEPLHARTAICMTGFPRSFFSRFPEQVEHTPSPSKERGLPERWWEEVAWAGAADPRFPHEMVLATSLRNHLLRPLSAYGGYDLFIIEPGLTHDARYEQLLRTDTLNALGVADGYFLQQAGPEQPLHYDNSSKRWRLYISESSVQSLLWQLKHLDMCHDLVAAHAEQHGLEYKYAIKVRPDVAYTKPVPPLHLLDLHPHPEEPARERSRHARSTIYVPAGVHNSKPRDHFAVGPYDAMRYYLQRYRAINTWAPLDIKRWTAEDFMSRYVSTAMRVSRELHVFGVRATNCKRQCERNGAASLFTRPSALDRHEV